MNGTAERLAPDVSAVLLRLRTFGPRTLGQLCHELAGEAWDPDRVERAVVLGWNAGLLSVDVDDRLLAL